MRVLHVAQPTEGGVPDVVGALARDQLQRGWDVHLARPDNSVLAHSVADASHHAWEARRSPGLRTTFEIRNLATLLRTIDPDVIHLHSAKAGLAGRAAIRGRRPTIFQPHAWSFDAVGGSTSLAARAWERTAARWSDVILCVGRAERERGVAAGVEGEWEVVQNGVDLHRWRKPTAVDREQSRQRLDLTPHAPTVVCVGRLTQQKGQDVLVRAWRSVHARDRTARLLLTGDGDAREALEAMQVPQVHLLGRVEDARDHYLAADLVVVASRWEGMSLAMLEGMACMRPVVTTAVPGAEVVSAAGAGAVVPIDDPFALSDAILDRLHDPERLEKEGERARRAVETHHDRDRVNQRIASIYETVVERRAKCLVTEHNH